MKILYVGILLATAMFLWVAGGRGYEIWSDLRGRVETRNTGSARTLIPIAVLGDSDSHAYHDNINFPGRFGRYNNVTFQWTEVLSKLRGSEVDLGEWGVRGTRLRTAVLMDWLGFYGRYPRKEDNLYNLAFGGAPCESLMEDGGRQAPRLVAEMDRDPLRWRRGIVVIRIGINNMGGIKDLDLLARDPSASKVQTQIAECLKQIRSAVNLIRTAHPMTSIMLVGVLSNADDPSTFDHWQSAAEYKNIKQGLQTFDHGLRLLAAGDKRIAFFDDQAWFEDHWGSRGEHGQPEYKTFYVGPQRFPVTLTQGDRPNNAVTQDLHAGVVWTTLWAQSLVVRINSAFDTKITPISDDEVSRFLSPAISSASD